MSKSSARTSGAAPLLHFNNIDTHYGELHVLKGVSYEIWPGEIVCLLGGNASGKSTTMKTILGVVRPTSGSLLFRGEDISRLRTAERVRRGISTVPETRRLFPRMTVLENLEMGAFTRRDRVGIDEDLERVYGLFPRVKDRRQQLAGTLSGGEQQMVAMGRALMARPTLLCMDEPSMGLSPRYVEQVFEIIQTINKQGTAIFVVEQNANMALSIASYGYVLQTGQLVLAGDPEMLLNNDWLRSAYLGGVSDEPAGAP
ncbi:ABC transporter ATP-binding protein [Phenylobacterium sp.]|uniref:ABC transporter ATP-binding protein n=1 Tax=Phenylobacterium sp. TaxID=1871053 RepID=UPI002FC94628